MYTSEELEKLWNKGFVTVQEVTQETAEYCAGYIQKKLNGKAAEKYDEETGLKHYERLNTDDGTYNEVTPEYAIMSRGGTGGRGIGYSWIKKYKTDCYPKDYLTIKGKKFKPPPDRDWET